MTPVPVTYDRARATYQPRRARQVGGRAQEQVQEDLQPVRRRGPHRLAAATAGAANELARAAACLDAGACVRACVRTRTPWRQPSSLGYSATTAILPV